MKMFLILSLVVSNFALANSSVEIRDIYFSLENKEMEKLIKIRDHARKIRNDVADAGLLKNPNEVANFNGDDQTAYLNLLAQIDYSIKAYTLLVSEMNKLNIGEKNKARLTDLLNEYAEKTRNMGEYFKYLITAVGPLEMEAKELKNNQRSGNYGKMAANVGRIAVLSAPALVGSILTVGPAAYYSFGPTIKITRYELDFSIAQILRELISLESKAG